MKSVTPQGELVVLALQVTKSDLKKLADQARLASEKAYAPYSGYRVGSALLGVDGNIFTGCNIENSSHGAAVCAERVAIFKAVSTRPNQKFTAMAIYAQSEKKPMPCGICRQVLWELAGDIDIVVVSGSRFKTLKLSELYPKPF